MNQPVGSPGVRLSVAEREQLRKQLDRLGDDRAASALCVHRVTIYRALAGRDIRPSTAECLRSRLRALQAPEPGAAA